MPTLGWTGDRKIVTGPAQGQTGALPPSDNKLRDSGFVAMLFLTYWFVLFAAFTFPLYWLVRHRAARLTVLFVFCAVFHTHFAGPAGVLPIVALGVVSYLAGLTRNRWLCLGGIVLCVAALVFYKYS